MPGWMMKNYRNPKILPQKTFPNNYRPITFLPIIGKILTAQIKKKSITRLYTADYFRKNKKDATKEKTEKMAN